MADPRTMLYRCPGPKKLHGVECETLITTDVKAAKADGWHDSPADAQAALDKPKKTRKKKTDGDEA